MTACAPPLTQPSALAIPLVVPQGLWAIGITILALMAVTLLVEVLCRLAAGDAAGIDALLGPRGFEEETEEALEAVGMTRPAQSPEELASGRPVAGSKP